MVQMNGRNRRKNPESVGEDSTEVVLYGNADTEEAVWGCNICNARFRSSGNLRVHTGQLHRDTHPAECGICLRRFLNDAQLGTHLKFKHIQGPIRPSSPQLPEKTVIKSRHGMCTKRWWKKNCRETLGYHKPSASTSAETVLSTEVSTSGEGDKTLPLPPPKKRRGIVRENHESFPCRICKIQFDSYVEWREHAVFKHIFTKNPYPIVEMNYVHVDTSQLESNDDVTSTVVINHDEEEEGEKEREEKSPEDERNRIQEENPKEALRLTICKNKGRSYMVKKSSVSSTDTESAEEGSRPASGIHLGNVSDDVQVAEAISYVSPEPCTSEMAAGGVSVKHRLSLRVLRRSLDHQWESVDTETREETNSENTSTHVEGTTKFPPAHDEQEANSMSTIRHAVEKYPRIAIQPVLEASAVASISDQTSIPLSAAEATSMSRNMSLLISSISVCNVKTDEAEEDAVESVRASPGQLGHEEWETMEEDDASTQSTGVTELSPEDDASTLFTVVTEPSPKDEATGSTREQGEGEGATPVAGHLTLESVPEPEMISERTITTTNTDAERAMVEFEPVPPHVEESVSNSSEVRMDQNPQFEHSGRSASRSEGEENEVHPPQTRSKDPSVPSLSPCPPGSPLTEATISSQFQVNGSEEGDHSLPNSSNSAASSPHEGVSTSALPLQSSIQNPPSASCVDSSDSADSGLHIHLAEEPAVFEDVSDDEAEKPEAGKKTEAPAESVPQPHPGIPEEKEVSGKRCSGDAGETDDFQCRICGKIFASDDEVKEHFSAKHFRVEVSSNILEPESPAPAHIHSHHREMYVRELEEQRRKQDLAHLPRRDSAGSPCAPNPRNANSSVLVLHAPLPLRQQQHQPLDLLRCPSDSYSSAEHSIVQVPNYSAALRPPLLSAPANFDPKHQQQMRGDSVFAAVPPASSGRPPYMMGPAPLSLQRHTAPHPEQQQHQNFPRSLHMALTCPTSNSSPIVPQQQRSPSGAPRSSRSPHDLVQGPRGADVNAMMQRARSSQNPPSSLGLYGKQRNDVPTNLTVAHQQPSISRRLHPGPPPPPPPPSQVPRSLPQQQMAHQQIRNDPLLRLSSPSSIAQAGGGGGGGGGMRSHQSTLPVQQLMGSGSSHLVLGKRSASGEILDASLALNGGKQSRVSPSGGIHPYNGINLHYDHLNRDSGRVAPAHLGAQHVAHTSKNQPVPPSKVSPSLRCLPSPPEAAIGKSTHVPITSSGGISSVRLGNAITLSVCPSSESQQQQQQQQQGIVNSGPSRHPPSDRSYGGPIIQNLSSPVHQGLSPTMAARAVTVAPISPPMAHEVGAHRYKIQSTSPIVPTTPCSSPTYSVIQRAGMPKSPSSASNSPPVGGNVSTGAMGLSAHQFAVPRIPAPRAVMPLSLALNPTERPDRPPTVDLTAEDFQFVTEGHGRLSGTVCSILASATGRLGGGRAQGSSVPNSLEHGNSLQRPAYVCNHCNILFSSEQLLEEHEIITHGSSQRSNSFHRSAAPATVPPNRTAPGNVEQQARQQHVSANRHPTSSQNQQLIRSVSPARPLERSSKNLYIPLLDLGRLDPHKLKRLDDIGISLIVPLHGNEPNLGFVGIPVMSLRQDGVVGHYPWDNVLPFGPAYSASRPGGGKHH